jgi:hypothetical protein
MDVDSEEDDKEKADEKPAENSDDKKVCLK